MIQALCRDDGSFTAASLGPSHAETSSSPMGATTAWLEYLVVYGGADWSFDLSSQFQASISNYGVIVPAEFDNVTLCTVPFEGDPNEISAFSIQ